ncbi:MAG: hypothetical protein QME60_03705 [Verrucomicrobiota bacterium]|nr:hypothetical protein [Verrucomicrobiota bacterium]
MLTMLKHVKSLVAVALAALVTAGAGLWLRHQSLALQDLNDQHARMAAQIAAGGAYPALLARAQERLMAARRETEQLLGGFARAGQEEAMLVSGVTRAASAAGLDIVHAARSEAGAGDGRPVRTTSYNLALRGSYPGAVRFFQNLATGELIGRVDSLDIHAPEDPNPSGAIQVDMTLSVFSAKGAEK